jgi:hypothetical protein
MPASANRLTDSIRPEGRPGVLAIGAGRRLSDSAAPAGDAKLIVSAGVYDKLLSLADQAPLDGLPVAPRTLARARTLGYNHVGQVRCTSANRLVLDFGVEHADELLRALYAFGLRQQDSGSGDDDRAG